MRTLALGQSFAILLRFMTKSDEYLYFYIDVSLVKGIYYAYGTWCYSPQPGAHKGGRNALQPFYFTKESAIFCGLGVYRSNLLAYNSCAG